MLLPSVLAQVDFTPSGPPKIFRISVAAELGRPALAETALKQHRHPRFGRSRSHGDTLNAQAALAKISIRSHPARCILNCQVTRYPLKIQRSSFLLQIYPPKAARFIYQNPPRPLF
jgi:hypothetical protein